MTTVVLKTTSALYLHQIRPNGKFLLNKNFHSIVLKHMLCNSKWRKAFIKAEDIYDAAENNIVMVQL